MSDHTEEPPRQRPNPGYKLSNEKVNGDEVVFHYSREHRLEKAPQVVRDLYTLPNHRFNLIKPLIRTRPLAMMFFSILVACVLIVLVSLLGLAGTSYMLEGNHMTIQAIRFEGTIIMAINKSTKKSPLDRFSRSSPPYTGAVDIAIQPVQKTGAGAQAPSEVPENLFFHKIFFTFEPEEFYRFSVPFDAQELAVVVQSENKTLRLTVKAE